MPRIDRLGGHSWQRLHHLGHAPEEKRREWSNFFSSETVYYFSPSASRSIIFILTHNNSTEQQHVTQGENVDKTDQLHDSWGLFVKKTTNYVAILPFPHRNTHNGISNVRAKVDNLQKCCLVFVTRFEQVTMTTAAAYQSVTTFGVIGRSGTPYILARPKSAITHARTHTHEHTLSSEHYNANSLQC